MNSPTEDPFATIAGRGADDAAAAVDELIGLVDRLEDQDDLSRRVRLVS